MTDEELVAIEEFISAYRYIDMRIEFLAAFCSWMCLSSYPGISTSDNDLQLAHCSLYTGLWVETQPSDESWPVQIFMGKKVAGLN